MRDVKQLQGTKFAGYSILRILGEGADGIVYAASCNGQEVAIKFFFRDALERNGVEEGIRRLELQMQLKGRKPHPHLVEILDGGFDEEINTLYLIMELIPGSSLDKVIAEIPRSAIHTLLRQLASAAEFLSKNGLVHRDIKPANIVVSADYSNLTLLDLGIVLTVLNEDNPRLSGEKFVATTRYSPPEFVWRTEDSQDMDAWNAITYYQIGATLHDLIMRKPLFDGFDQPHARLYDAVKHRSPVLDAKDCDPWMIGLAKCCLVKNWRERIQLVSWASFTEPSSNKIDLTQQQKLIRLKQIRNQERRAMDEAEKTLPPTSQRIHQLWELQNSVFMEIRQYFMSTYIFPSRFSATHEMKSETAYCIRFEFEQDSSLGFNELLNISVLLSVSELFDTATTMTVAASTPSQESLFEAKWSEMLTVESAVGLIQAALMEVADHIIPD